jgi:uncharacterized protein (TIGR02246 family)
MFALKNIFYGTIVSSLICTGAFADTKSADEAAIRAALNDITAAYQVRDANRAMASYAPNVLVFDLPPPLEQVGKAGNLKTTQVVMEYSTGPMIFAYRDVNVTIFDPEYAYSTAIVALAWKMKTGSAVNLLDRTTDVWQKIDGKWLIIHEHNSVPVDMVTGKAVFNAGMSGATQPFQTK